jgi:hypothetical protein
MAMDLDLAKFVEHEGVLGAALVGLGVVFWRIGQRLTAALDKAGERFEQGTQRIVDKLDAQHASIVQFSTKLDVLVEYNEHPPTVLNGKMG